MLGSIPTYQFLQWMEVSGRLEAGARVFSSSGWRFSDCRRPMGVLIVPATGGIRTVKKCHNRREARSRIMSLQLWMKHILNLRRELYLNRRRQLRCTR